MYITPVVNYRMWHNFQLFQLDAHCTTLGCREGKSRKQLANTCLPGEWPLTQYVCTCMCVWRCEIFVYCSVCLCTLQSDADALSCLACHAVSHIICLARHFLDQQEQQHGFLLPINGSCPSCNADLLWGDLIRYKRGCCQKLSNEPVIVWNVFLLWVVHD